MRVPLATYRIQFNLGFRFPDARELVPYLHELGISDLYASPRFRPRKGSSHGYDVADPYRINSELGTEEDFGEVARRLRDYGMGLLLDIVPNHMAASHENPWWTDVLTHGPASRYAHFFDIDWRPATAKAAFLQENKVLLAVLGDLYGRVLENQDLALALDEQGFFVRYFEHRFPLDPKTYREPLEHAVKLLQGSQEAGDAGETTGNNPHSASSPASLASLTSLLDAIDRLPSRHFTDPDHVEERRRSGREIRELLWQLYHGDAEARRALDETLRHFNGVGGQPRSFDALDRLLADQAWRLAYWKIGTEEINYRRFFDINELVGLRVEDPEVFEARHASILQLVAEGKVTGLRVDHVDGLYDPRGYLERVQAYAAQITAAGAPAPLYVVAEKILGGDETLPAVWPVAGTTGYDFLNAAGGAFLEPEQVEAMEQVYARATGARTPFAEITYGRNHQVMHELFAGEVRSLGHHLGRIAAQDRMARDLPLYELVAALVETTACLPVYRTYVREGEISAQDRAYIERTLADARRRVSREHVSDAAFEFLRRVLLLDPPPYGDPDLAEWARFVARWQQFSGPVMAKGLEDTAFYVHNSLLSLNEVGGDIQRDDMVLAPGPFHSFNQTRGERWPHTLNATSTHDTKRSEDARARINVLPELAEAWAAHLARWSRWNATKRRAVGSGIVPAPSEEVMLYQALLGVWPLDDAELETLPERLKGFVVKSAREAKLHTSWLSPNTAHEEALGDFVEAILKPGSANRFLTDFLRFQKTIAHYGAFNALGQVLLKIASPGVPDFYQGSELWDFSLVDPDNRRPVDFARRAQALEELRRRENEGPSLARELAENWRDGRIKLFLTWRALRFRRDHPELFQQGEYIALQAAGRMNHHVIAFARRHEKQWVLAAVPRQLTALVSPGELPLGRDAWGAGALELPKGAPATWRNVLTGEPLRASSSAGKEKRLRLAGVFENFPAALLTNEEVGGQK